MLGNDIYASAPLLASTAKFIMSLLLKYNTFYLLAEITLKLGLQSTEEYLPYIVYAFLFLFFIM